MNQKFWWSLPLMGACAWGMAQTEVPTATPGPRHPAAPLETPSWKSVEKIMGRAGQWSGEAFQFSFPRLDLNATVQGFALDSQAALVSRFQFQRLPKGTQMTGRVFLMDPEVPQAEARALQNGLEITALYSPFLGETPGLKCLRLRGKGASESLAWAAKMVLSATGTPLDLKSRDKDPERPTPGVATPAGKAGIWKEIQFLLGPGEVQGPTLQYRRTEQDPESAPPNQVFLLFQKEGPETAAWGEFEVREEDSSATVAQILQKKAKVTAFFTENSLQGRRSFVDFWASGEEKEVGEELKEILAKTDF